MRENLFLQPVKTERIDSIPASGEFYTDPEGIGVTSGQRDCNGLMENVYKQAGGTISSQSCGQVLDIRVKFSQAVYH